MKKGLVIAGALLLVVAPLIVITGTVYTLLLPNIYAAQALISVTDNTQRDPYASGNSQTPAYNPYFLRTQFEIIQSKPVFDEVINRLNLQERWGRNGEKIPNDIALAILRSSVSVFQHRDTTLLSISCKRPDPNEAAIIANALAQAYRDACLDKQAQHKKIAIEKMDEALQEQAQRVLDAEARVSEIRENFELAENAEGKESIVIRKAKADLENERFIYNQLKSRLQQERLRLEDPRNLVQIVDLAEPNLRPVSPNLFLNIVLSCIAAGLFALVGAILLTVGLISGRSKGNAGTSATV